MDPISDEATEAMRSFRRRWQRARAVALAGAVAVLIAAIGAPAVLAHAELVSSTPADGSEMASPPTEIRLVFSEAPRLDSLSVRLFDRRGTEVALGKPGHGPLATTVIVPIPTDLRPGPYTVVWFVVSAEDEHPETKEFVFGVGEPPGAPSVTADQLADGAGNTLLPVAMLLAILGLTLMLGAAVQARFFGLDGPKVAGLGLIGAGVSASALVVRAFGAPRAAATISDGSSGLFNGLDLADVARVGLLGAFIALVLVAREAAAGRSRRRLWLAAVIGAVGLAWLQAASSHAAGVGILPWVSLAWRGIDLAIADPSIYPWFGPAFEVGRQLNVVIGAAHAVAVGAWVGGLLVVSLGGLPADQLRDWHPRFSRFALRAFLVVAATGLYQAVLYLPSPAALVETGYGQVLVAKHLFVAGILAMAAINRFVAGPALRRAGDHGRVVLRARLAIRGEALVGIGVLAVTGLLATTAPARPSTAIFLRPDIVASFAGPTATVAGDRAGFELRVTSLSATQQRFELMAAVPLAASPKLRLDAQGEEVTRSLPLRPDGGLWRAEGIAFARDGPWTGSIQLADGTAVTFPLEVGFGRVLRYDRPAREAWDAAIARTESDMRSARMIDQLTDGSSLMLFGFHEFEAPDLERFDIQGRFSTITADGRRYTREEGSDNWTERDAGPLGWPSFTFLRAAVGVTVEGEASQAGKRCRVLAGTDPQSDVTFELWIGMEDGMIHRLVMGVPGHYMVNAYYDVNEPVEIVPPASALPDR